MRHEVETSYTLIDIQQSIILVFMMLLALIFALVQIEKKVDENQKSPGDIIVQLYWDDSSYIDMDLWVKAPNDKPVGYSNKAGIYFNLLRDDLGMTNDISGTNEEVAYTRGQPDGEYIVNVHSYSAAGKYPVIARVMVFHRNIGGTISLVWEGSKEFKGPNQEITMIRFIIRNDNIEQPFNFVPYPLRVAK